MFEKLMKFLKKMSKTEQETNTSKDTAKERLHLVLMQDRANVSADFLELMKQEIIEVIKKYIEIDEEAIDVRLTNKANDDGTTGAPSLYANIPIMNIRNEMKKETMDKQNIRTEEKKEETKETENENNKKEIENKEDANPEKEEKVKESKEDEKEEEINKEEDKKENNNEEDEKQEEVKKEEDSNNESEKTK